MWICSCKLNMWRLTEHTAHQWIHWRINNENIVWLWIRTLSSADRTQTNVTANGANDTFQPCFGKCEYFQSVPAELDLIILRRCLRCFVWTRCDISAPTVRLNWTDPFSGCWVQTACQMSVNVTAAAWRWEAAGSCLWRFHWAETHICSLLINEQTQEAFLLLRP